VEQLGILCSTLSCHSSDGAMWNELLLVVVMEMLVAWQCSEEGRLVSDLGQLSVVTPELMGTVSIRCSRMNTGRWVSHWLHAHRSEVHRRDSCQLVKSRVHLLVVLHTIIRRVGLDGSEQVVCLCVRDLNLLLAPERPLDFLHPTNTGRPRMVRIAIGKILWWASKRSVVCHRRQNVALICSIRRSVPGAAQRSGQPYSARFTQVLLDGLLEGAWEHIIERRIINTSDGLCADEVVQLARQIVKLRPHLSFFLHLCLYLLVRLISRQVFLGPISSCFNLFNVGLAAIIVMEEPATVPTSIKLLDDCCTMVEKHGVQPLCPF